MLLSLLPFSESFYDLFASSVSLDHCLENYLVSAVQVCLSSVCLLFDCRLSVFGSC